MRNRIAFLLCVTIALTLASCDDKSSGPDQPDATLLASAIIGADGGELSYEGFELTVPAGAIAAPASIDLYESTEDAGFGDDMISPPVRRQRAVHVLVCTRDSVCLRLF